MRLSKIYTKVGDKGTTQLASGEFVVKHHPRIEAYGTVDELNAHVGLLREELLDLDGENLGFISLELARIQNELFDVGGELSTPLKNLDVQRQQVVTKNSIERLEIQMDEFNKTLEPLKNFVLPGGHRANALAHVTRTIARRAERAAWKLNAEESLRSELLIYLNRLSDWLFVVSRVISKDLMSPEILWSQNK